MTIRVAVITDGAEPRDDLAALSTDSALSVVQMDACSVELDRPLPDDADCVVIDHDPPDIDGVAICAWLHDHYPGVPRILAPVRNDLAVATAAANAPIDAYVPQRAGGSSRTLRAEIERLASHSAPNLNSGDSERTAVSDMFESLLTSVPRWVSIYVKDRQGRHVAVSGPEDAFEDGATIHTPDGQVLWSREDILGKTDFDLYPREHAEATRDQEQRIMRTEEPDVAITERVDDPVGNTHYYSTTKAPWYDDEGNVAGIVGITVDITDRMQHQQAIERQNERLDRFAGVLSHDIRNPLNIAAGQLELLRGENLPEGATDSVDELGWALDRIETLIEDTLALAREGAVVRDPEAVELRTAAEEAWRATGDDHATLRLDDDLPTVGGDPDRVQRLYENLFRNALDHGREHDEDDLEIHVGPLDDGFFVADDGRGIPEDVQEKVFDHGFTTSDRGTGFGLAIVEEIAAAHGWERRVTTGADGGARFEFHDVDIVED